LTSQTPRGSAVAGRERNHFGGDANGRAAHGLLRTDSEPAQPAGGMSQAGASGNRSAGRRRRSRRTSSTATSEVGRWPRWPGEVWRHIWSECCTRPEPWRGTKPMEGEGASLLATAGRRYGPGSGVRPRGRGSSERDSTCVVEFWRLDGEGARVAVMRRGCSRGDFFEGCEGRLREWSHAGSSGVVVFGRRYSSR